MRRGTILILILVARLAGAAPTTLVRAGDPSPLGLLFSRFSDAAIDDRGQVGFVGASTVLFRRNGDRLTLMVSPGQAIGARTITGVGPPALDASGCIVFRAGFVTGGAGVFRRCDSDVTLVVEVGATAPGGGRFAGIGDEVAAGAGGRVVFMAVLDDGATGIFLAVDGTIQEITRTGAPSPAGGTFSGLRLVGITAGGRVGFRAATSGGPDGLFFWEAGVVQKLVVVGDASPVGGSFTAVGLATVNDGGAWTFRGAVSGDGRTGVFAASTDSFLPIFTTVALTGDATPIGGTFQDFPTALVPSINATGRIGFRATLDGAPYPSGVFASRSDGSLEKIVAVNESTAAGRLVRLREVALADDGGVVLRASLTGGTPGLFRVRGGRVEPLALLGDATELGDGFRFSNPAVRETVDGTVFLGVLEALFVSGGPGDLRTVAVLGQPTPLGGKFAGIDPPASGGRQLAFGASIQEGRSGEALFSGGGRRARVLARVGSKVRGCGRIADFFSNPLDDLAHPGTGPGSVAFQAALEGGGASGIIVSSGGGLRAAACEGKRAAGGGTYHEFGTPAAGAGGRVAFVALARNNASTLFHGSASAMRMVASAGRDTNTRLLGAFRTFDTPAISGAAVTFRAVLDQAREGIFFARGRCLTALAGSGESEPGGGRFRTFGAPAFAAGGVVFRASIAGAAHSSAIFRATPQENCTQLAPSIETLVSVSSPSPSGPPFLGFGTPSANRRGTIAFTADITGAGPTDAVVVLE